MWKEKEKREEGFPDVIEVEKILFPPQTEEEKRKILTPNLAEKIIQAVKMYVSKGG